MIVMMMMIINHFQVVLIIKVNQMKNMILTLKIYQMLVTVIMLVMIGATATPTVTATPTATATPTTAIVIAAMKVHLMNHHENEERLQNLKKKHQTKQKMMMVQIVVMSFVEHLLIV